MKRAISTMIIIFISIVSNGCYKSRVELFTIPIVAATYSYSDSEGIYFLEKQITTMEITFTATDKAAPAEDEYEINHFGDFSFEEVKVFTIQLVIEFDETQHDCEMVFMGIANPQRPNAYRALVTIPGLSDQEDTFNVVFDFDKDDKNHESLQVINVQIKDFVNDTPSQVDAYFDLEIQETESDLIG